MPPTRQGFGSVLIEKVTAQDFGAQPKIRFAPEGVSYEINAPPQRMTTPEVMGYSVEVVLIIAGRGPPVLPTRILKLLC